MIGVDAKEKHNNLLTFKAIEITDTAMFCCHARNVIVRTHIHPKLVSEFKSFLKLYRGLQEFGSLPVDYPRMKLFLKRYFAYLFDCGISYTAVMLLLQWLVLTPLRKLWGIDELWFHNAWNLQLYVWISISLPVWCYFAFLDSRKNKGTLGKRLLRLEVTNEQGNKISLGKSFVRTFFKLLPWELAHVGVIFPSPLYFAESGDIRPLTIAGLILLFIYALSILISPKRQCIYDMILGTRVKEKKPLDKSIIIEKTSI